MVRAGGEAGGLALGEKGIAGGFGTGEELADGGFVGGCDSGAEGGEVGGEGVEGGEEGGFVSKEDVGPHGGVGGGDAGGVEEAASDGLEHFGVGGGSVDEGEGEGVGEVANGGDPLVVHLCGEGDDAHAEGLPEGLDLVEGGGIGGGGLLRGVDGGVVRSAEEADGIFVEVVAGRVGAGLFAAGHGVGADEMDGFGEEVGGPLEDVGLG